MNHPNYLPHSPLTLLLLPPLFTALKAAWATWLGLVKRLNTACMQSDRNRWKLHAAAAADTDLQAWYVSPVSCVCVCPLLHVLLAVPLILTSYPPRLLLLLLLLLPQVPQCVLQGGVPAAGSVLVQRCCAACVQEPGRCILPCSAVQCSVHVSASASVCECLAGSRSSTDLFLTPSLLSSATTRTPTAEARRQPPSTGTIPNGGICPRPRAV